ncbi:UPF0496 protein 4-like [Fagus crenata]
MRPSKTPFSLPLAVDFISFAHTKARSLISNLKLLSDSDLDVSLAWYLEDHNVKLLDLCNSISSEIERLRHRRLFLNFLLQLLTPSETPPLPEKLRRAQDLLSDFDKNNNTVEWVSPWGLCYFLGFFFCMFNRVKTLRLDVV